MTNSVHDICSYILQRQGAMSAWKLHKLLYYCQGWSLAWTGAPLFQNRIEGWRDGPVVRDVWAMHRNDYAVRAWPRGDVGNLTDVAVQTINAVLEAYGHLHGDTLIRLTHREQPWIDSRKGLAPGDRGSAEIPTERLRGFFSPLADPAANEVPEQLRRGLSMLVRVPEHEVDSLSEDDSVDGERFLEWFESGQGILGANPKTEEELQEVPSAPRHLPG